MWFTDGVLGASRLKTLACAAVGGVGLLAASGVIAPKPALAWWRSGVWIAGPAPGYYGPRPYYYPPVVVAPPPVYYAAPPVIYAPPPTVYYPPQTAAPMPAAARACYTPALTCPMEVARTPGTSCYCTDSVGERVWGRAQ